MESVKSINHDIYGVDADRFQRFVEDCMGMLQGICVTAHEKRCRIRVQFFDIVRNANFVILARAILGQAKSHYARLYSVTQRLVDRIVPRRIVAYRVQEDNSIYLGEVS